MLTNTRRIPAKPAALDAEAMKRGDRRGGALVHVRRPDVEGDGGHLEAEADEEQGEAGEEQPVLGEDVGLEELGDGARLVEPVAP